MTRQPDALDARDDPVCDSFESSCFGFYHLLDGCRRYTAPENLCTAQTVGENIVARFEDSRGRIMWEGPSANVIRPSSTTLPLAIATPCN